MSGTEAAGAEPVGDPGSWGAGEAERAGDFIARRDGFARESADYAGRVRVLSNVRLVTFVLVVASLVWAELAGGGGRLAPLGLAGVFAMAFVASLAAHRRSEEKRRWYAELARLNEESAARIRREWDRLPVPRIEAAGADHPYAEDVDLFGRGSVAHLLGPVGTPAGLITLRRWLLEPVSPAEIGERQAAVAALSDLPDVRGELAAHGRLSEPVTPAELDRFLGWAESEPWLTPRGALVWAGRALPAATVVFAAAHMAGWFAFGWIPALALALLVSRRVGSQAAATYERALPRPRLFRRYSRLFALLESMPTPALERIRAGVTSGGRPAHQWMRRLERLMEIADARHSPMLHFALQALFVWDIHVVVALERWQVGAGRSARRWFDTLGEAEALAALAALADEHPRWSVPSVGPMDSPRFTAELLGHPLLPGSARVHNDVEIGPPGTYVLVTGSNMSGKSTLLRAVGVNAVLAQAGAPICGPTLRMPPVTLCTSMRVQDSLQEGVSYFMAGLKRLKDVVDAANDEARRDGRVLLYLLDEILQGTNTAERLAASRRIVRHLVESGAIGAVTTHDLALAAADELEPACRPVHFRETIHDEKGTTTMSFDYRLRPGVATSTNALRLMEIVGLRV